MCPPEPWFLILYFCGCREHSWSLSQVEDHHRAPQNHRLFSGPCHLWGNVTVSTRVIRASRCFSPPGWDWSAAALGGQLCKFPQRNPLSCLLAPKLYLSWFLFFLGFHHFFQLCNSSGSLAALDRPLERPLEGPCSSCFACDSSDQQ